MSATMPRVHAAAQPNVIRNTLTLARRTLLHIKSDPEQLTGMTIQPLMFLALFVYVFGGAISSTGSSKDYLQFALPGIMVQGTAFTPFSTALGLNVDFQRGVIDRFRSLPIARSSVIAGRILGDAVRIVWGVLVMYGFGAALGFGFDGGLLGAIGAGLVITAFGVTICWPMAFLGVTVKSTEAVNTFGFMLILPLTFASSTFVPVETMPGWLQAFANVNPITSVVDASRGLMVGGPVTDPLIETAIWLAIITGIFAPLAIGRYRRRL